MTFAHYMDRSLLDEQYGSLFLNNNSKYFQRILHEEGCV